MQVKNSQGLEFTAASDASVSQFEGVTTAYMGLRRDIGQRLEALSKADPEMPMTLCLQGYFSRLMASPRASERAIKLSARLQQLLQHGDANPREKMHGSALESWNRGDMLSAVRIWEQILSEYPCDGIALRLAQFAHFYVGDTAELRDSVKRALPHWAEDHPDYHNVLGMYAFGLEECGDYAEAEKAGRAAALFNPEDAWSVHAVAHVFEMTHRVDEGIEWVQSLEADWTEVNNFRFHLYWHLALYYMAQENYEAVLSLYDTHVKPAEDTLFYLDTCNATSLLWRLELRGVDVGNRWEHLAAMAIGHSEDRELVFVNLHYLLPLLATNDRDGVQRVLLNLEDWSCLDGTQATVCRDVALDLAKTLAALRRGTGTGSGIGSGNGSHAWLDNKRAQLQQSVYRIGGSHAQHKVFLESLLPH